MNLPERLPVNKKKSKYSALCLALYLLTINGGSALADVRIIDNIEISTNAETAIIAKDKAFAKARREAVKKVAADSGLSSAATKKLLKNRSADNAVTFVEVSNEKMSGQSYTATFRVGVDDKLLSSNSSTSNKEQPHSPSTEKWILVIPAHRTIDETIVWQKDDPWIAKWKQPLARRNTDYLVLEGDTEDAAMFRSVNFAAPDNDTMLRLAEKYKTAAVFIAVFDNAFAENPITEGVVELILWSPQRGFMKMRSPISGTEAIVTKAYTTAIENMDLLANSAFGIDVTAEYKPDAQTTYPMDMQQLPTSEIPISISLTSRDRWLEINSQLSSIPNLSLTPVSVSNSKAEFVARYAGTREQLENELRQHGMIE